MLKIQNHFQKPVKVNNNSSRQAVSSLSTFKGQLSVDCFETKTTKAQDVSFQGWGPLGKLFSQKDKLPKVLQNDPQLKDLTEKAIDGDKKSYFFLMSKLEEIDNKDVSKIKKYFTEKLSANLNNNPKKIELYVLSGAVAELSRAIVNDYGVLYEYSSINTPGAGIITRSINKRYNKNNEILKAVLSENNPLQSTAKKQYLEAAFDTLKTEEQCLRITHSKLLAINIIKKHSTSVDDVKRLADTYMNSKESSCFRAPAIKALPELIKSIQAEEPEKNELQKNIIVNLQAILEKEKNVSVELQLATMKTLLILTGNLKK